jgi:5-(carboxyamino)imidazole ribonucleotide mutase
MNQPIVAIIMGSESDRSTMQHAADHLTGLGIGFEMHVLSAHRTPEKTAEFARTSEQRGFEVIIAGAGGAAHLPGVLASWTLLPVIGVPIESAALHGLDSLLSIVQMPRGVPVATMAIGKPGAANAALMAAAILARKDATIRERLVAFRRQQAESATKHAP